MMILDKLDRKPAQVYLATVIGQLSLGDGYNLGIDYLTQFNRLGKTQGFTSSLITANEGIATNNNITDLRNNLVTAPFGPLKGFNIYGEISETIQGYVSALESTSRFKVLSRPSVFALNNKKAVITSGQQIPYPSQTITNSNNVGNVTSTVDYKDVVLKLEVVPLINPNGEVTLTIAQINDTVVGTQRIEPNEVPIIGTENLITTVTVPNGKTIVLGGLISEQNKRDTEGIPLVSRIPLLGNLFKENRRDRDRKELIIFIQPQVVEDENALFNASNSEDIRTEIGLEAAKKFPQTPVDPAVATPDQPKKKGWLPRLFDRKKNADTPSAAER